MIVSFVLNGRPVEVAADPPESLLDMLRERLGLPGTKKGCEKGDCGACTVLLDGAPVCSCLVPALQVEGSTVLTIEGFAESEEFFRYEQAFLEAGAVQCGYCTPGILLSAKALLDRIPHPDHEEIRTALAGNLCRCTGYQQVVEAVAVLSGRRTEEVAR